jgi:transposase
MLPLTDAEWAIVAPMIPPGRHGGRGRSVNVREVLNGIFYVLWTGCRWKALPRDLPPKSTVPGVRVIAERFGVNPSTVQRINRPFDGASVAVA